MINLTNVIRNEQLDELTEAIKSNPHLVNQPDERGFTPLVLATYLGKETVARLLIENGADIDARDAMMGNTALMGVCFKGAVKLAQLLIEKGANTALKNNNGETALDFAKNGGHQEIVSILTQRIF
ncbi:MAG: ankyrin repeat domain-containing protein [Bacteroidota bacterium]